MKADREGTRRGTTCFRSDNKHFNMEMLVPYWPILTDASDDIDTDLFHLIDMSEWNIYWTIHVVPRFPPFPPKFPPFSPHRLLQQLSSAGSSREAENQ